MAKRILSIVLCVVLLAGSLAGCKSKTVAKDTGGYITMYLTDEIYDFDPANAYYNSNLSDVLSLMYATLFRLTDSGKVENYLVKSYKIFENAEADEYYMELKLRETYWSVQDALTAEDVVFAWKRLVNSKNNYEAATLLYDIKNARAVKEGDASIDNLGVEAVEQSVVRVTFEGPTDYNRFIRNLTSVATAPLLNRYVSANPYDWAKKPSSIATSGPFKLSKINYQSVTDEKGNEIKVTDDYALNKDGTVSETNSNKKWATKKLQYFVLERNSYFDRDLKRDQVNATVTPYRLLVDCTKTDEELMTEYENGRLFYVGNLPFSLSENQTVQDDAEITDQLSTFVCYLNENALIGGEFLFANSAVRRALSLALDREAIAKTVVYAKAADGLLPYGIFEKGNSGEFRKSKDIKVKLNTTAQLDEAKQLLSEAGITPSDYSFSIKVAAYSKVHTTMVEAIAEAWNELGFKVTVDKIQPIQNNDLLKEDEQNPTSDICDDIWVEAIRRGNYEVIALDACAMTADAYSMLSTYAYAFSGAIYADNANNVYEYETHVTGYNSVAYNILMEAIYYLPYFAKIDSREKDSYLVTHLQTQPYVAMASTAEHRLNAAAASAEKAISDNLKKLETLNPDETKDIQAMIDTYTAIISAIDSQLNGASAELLPLSMSLTAANGSDEAETAAKAALQKAMKDVTAAAKLATAASDTKVDKENATSRTQFYQTCADAISAYKTAIASEKAAAEAAKAVAESADPITLKDAISKVYTENEIDFTVKISKQEKLRAKLLHRAEEMILNDMPVIPIAFNQKATLTGKMLSKVRSSYYCTADFQKAKLKNANAYVDEKGESIFKVFPEIYWDKMVG